jgi:cellulose synthase/poly-beta-1,6-N-acetylglucosamine synthase-like glycosyltransferase
MSLMSCLNKDLLCLCNKTMSLLHVDETLNLNPMLISILQVPALPGWVWLWAEAFRTVSTFVKAFQLVRPLKRKAADLKDMLRPADFPTVDVMIPCYNEPVKVRERPGG